MAIRPRNTSPSAPEAMTAEEIRELRDRTGLSQPGFARYLNVSNELVQAWESGRRVPNGAALRLLEIARKNPAAIFGKELVSETGELTPKRRPRKTPRRTVVVKERPPRAGKRTPALAASAAPPPLQFPATEFSKLISALAAARISYIIVGGLADKCHGVPGETDDIDILYDRSAVNLGRLARFLRELGATLRGAPGAPAFAGDERTLAHTTAIAFDTRHGPLDVRQRLTGIGDFNAARSLAEEWELNGARVLVLSRIGQISARRAVGRPRDRERLVLLEQLT